MAKKKRGRPKGKASKSATFRLPEGVLEQLLEQSELEERSQTIIVKRALEAYFKAQEEGEEDEGE